MFGSSVNRQLPDPTLVMIGFCPISNHVCGIWLFRIDVFGTSVRRPVSPAIENAVIDPLQVVTAVVQSGAYLSAT